MQQERHTTWMRRGLLAVLALSAVLSSGCTQYTTCRSWVANGFKVGPRYCRPAAPLEPEWIDMQSDPRLIGETADLSHWWRALGDPTLDALVESAYDQNLTLRQAAARIAQAQAARAIAVGTLFPQLQQAVGDFQRVQTSQNVAVPSPVHQFSQFDLGMQASWELDVWGRFRRSVEVADANLDVSIAGYDEVIVVLLADVAATYVEIRTVQTRLQIARTVIGLQKGSLEIANARYQADQTNKLDVIQAQNNIDVTEAAIPQFEAQLRMANNRLCILLGIPPQDLVSQLPPAPIPAVSRLVQVGIPADLLRRRPDIRLAERLLQAQSARIGIAESELYPHISLVGSFEWQAEDIDDLFNPGSVFALISPGFSWNVLNYGRLTNGVEFQRQKFRELVYSYQETVLTAQQEVEDAIVGFLMAQDQADKLGEAVAQVNEAEDIAVALYKTGATDFNRVFLIQAFQFSQQDDLAVSQASAVLNLIKIYRALGGGWQMRCPNPTGGAPLGIADDPSRGSIGLIPKQEPTKPTLPQPPLQDQNGSKPMLPPPPSNETASPNTGRDDAAAEQQLEKLRQESGDSGENPDEQSRLKELLKKYDSNP